MTKLHNIARLTPRRKELRKNMTPEEKILWWYLKDEGLGVKFRRQHSVGGYIVDFYYSPKKLVIEIDGGIHDTKENKEYDIVRDKFFTSLGYKILRFKNAEVGKDVKSVLSTIKKYLV